MTDDFNLDELADLNPSWMTFTIKGRTLKLGELMHGDYFRWYRLMVDFQASGAAVAAGGTPETVEVVRRAAVDLVMALFQPFNEDLERAFFEDITERKLQFLLLKAQEYQLSYVEALSREDEPKPGGQP